MPPPALVLAVLTIRQDPSPVPGHGRLSIGWPNQAIHTQQHRVRARLSALQAWEGSATSTRKPGVPCGRDLLWDVIRSASQTGRELDRTAWSSEGSPCRLGTSNPCRRAAAAEPHSLPTWTAGAPKPRPRLIASWHNNGQQERRAQASRRRPGLPHQAVRPPRLR
jgi:hypothetical protein